jgi:hypothetical protein
MGCHDEFSRLWPFRPEWTIVKVAVTSGGVAVPAGVGLGLVAHAFAPPRRCSLGIVVAAALGLDNLIRSLPRVGLKLVGAPCLNWRFA